MKLNKKLPIHKIVKDYPYRPALAYIKFSNGYAYSTDSHVAIKVSFDDLFENIFDTEKEMLEGKGIYYKYFEQIMKRDHVNVTDEYIEIKDAHDSVRYYFASDLSLPKIENIFNAPRTTVKNADDKGINIVLVECFKKVMNNPVLMINQAIGNAIMVVPAVKEYDITGIIMPTYVEE